MSSFVVALDLKEFSVALVAKVTASEVTHLAVTSATGYDNSFGLHHCEY